MRMERIVSISGLSNPLRERIRRADRAVDRVLDDPSIGVGWLGAPVCIRDMRRPVFFDGEVIELSELVDRVTSGGSSALEGVVAESRWRRLPLHVTEAPLRDLARLYAMYHSPHA